MHVSRRYEGLVTEKIHTTPELPNVTLIADTTVNSGPDTETFPQELTNYTEEVSSQRILPMVYISGNNPRSQQTRVNQDEESNKNLQISLNHRVEHEQMDKHGHYLKGTWSHQCKGDITVNLPMLQEYWNEDFSNVTSVQHGINSLSFNTLAANIDLQSLTSRSQPD